MSDIRDLLEASALRVLGDRRGAEQARAAGEAWPAALWAELYDLGLPLALVREDRGGADLSLGEGLLLLSALAAHPAPLPLPLGESMIAGHLLDRVGAQIPAGLSVVAPATPGDRVSVEAGCATGVLHRVPWARVADHLLVGVWQGEVEMLALIAPEPAAITHGANLAGEPRDTVTLANAPVVACWRFDDAADIVLHLGATLRTIQIAATCGNVLADAIDHANTRTQFGKPIGKFQAVQQNLAMMAGRAAAATGAAGLARDAATSNADRSGVAMGKVAASEAAGAVAALAHQTFGAIGFTAEHPLHRATKRLLSWRDEFGAEAYWSARIGQAAFAAGGGRYWQLVSGT